MLSVEGDVMNKYFDVTSGQENNNIGQPRRIIHEKGKLHDRLQLSDKEFYDEFKARHKYDRSERKDLIRMVKKIYVQ